MLYNLFHRFEKKFKGLEDSMPSDSEMIAKIAKEDPHSFVDIEELRETREKRNDIDFEYPYEG